MIQKQTENNFTIDLAVSESDEICIKSDWSIIWSEYGCSLLTSSVLVLVSIFDEYVSKCGKFSTGQCVSSVVSSRAKAALVYSKEHSHIASAIFSQEITQ